MTLHGTITCSECGTRGDAQHLTGWVVAVLSLTPLDVEARHPEPNVGAAGSTTDVLCPGCAGRAAALMQEAGDGTTIEQA